MTEKFTALCPCLSGQPYQTCCQPYHQQQQFPENAMLLMRSRYAAYVLKKIDYIVQTTVPSQQALLPVEELQAWADNTTWLGLEIVQYVPLSHMHSQVEFKAFFGQQAQTQVHHEMSLFVNIAQRWYFVDPTVALPKMKAPCVCGSMKKFKHCCGGLL
ncbi:YchJ family protein [Pasteurella sp. PK-2025]|uniref:YchJ family protein n=1 Tax=Pasteurella sp. PK-2025 TaxID=3413133 RepID=UPI003C760AB4